MKSQLYYTSLLLSIIISVSESSNAQSWLWAKGIGGTSYDATYSSVVDPNTGDIYSTGTFQGTVDFDPGPGTYYLTSTGGSNIFISKLNSTGNFVWAKVMEGSVNYGGYGYGSTIAFDPTGNGGVYTTGSFYGVTDFDPGEGTFNLSSGCTNPESGQSYCVYSMFISKLDGSGNFVWAQSILAPIDNNSNYTYDLYGLSIAVDPLGSGDVFVLSYAYPLGVYEDTHTYKFDDSGNFLWEKVIGGSFSGYLSAYSLALDPFGSGGVYITGDFEGTVDFDPGEGTFNLTSTGSIDIFISKLDYSGNFVWAKATSGSATSYTNSYSMAIDHTGGGDIYTTGGFSGTVDFDPGAGIFNLTSAGDWDIFISKLDGSGNFVWANAMGGSDGSGEGYSISLDPAGSGDIYSTGYFDGTVDFDPGSGIFNLTAEGAGDIFLSKINNAGIFEGALKLGGTGDDYASCVTLNNSGKINLTGNYYSPSITIGSTTLTNEGESDIFIAQLDGIGPSCTNIVTNTSDSGSGSLRDIVSCASNGATITFSLAPMSQITLTTGEIVINKTLIISGLGMMDLTISGNNTSRIFHLVPGQMLEIENLSLKSATALTNGGAILVEGNLHLENVLLQNNFQNGIPKGMTISPGGFVTVAGNVEIKN